MRYSPLKKTLLRKIFTRRLEHKIRILLAPTISEGWELNAQRYKGKPGKYLGDEWNKPEASGIDVPANQMVSYLDEKVFAPFLGTSNVILEIGPGGGRFTEVLLSKCNKLIAADVTPTMLKLLKERFGPDPKIEYLLLDGLGLSPISDKSVDAAFSYSVFAHLHHWDIFNYLSELSRVLVPGGKAIIEHPNTFSELGWKRFLKDLPISLNVHKLPGTITLMTPEIIKEFTQRAGLVLEDCITDTAKRDCISLIRKPNNE